MKAAEKAALILAIWIWLSGIWFTSSAWAQSNELYEAQRLYDHVILLYQRGKYAEAVPFAQKTLKIWEKNLGPEHPDVAAGLNILAMLYYDMGNYSAAEPLYNRSLVIREKALGPEHTDVANSLNNLAELYRAMGNYSAAEPLYKRGLKILSKVVMDPQLPDPDIKWLDMAYILNNFGLLYQDMGNYFAAERLLNQSLDIRERTPDYEHPVVAESLNNLASLYYRMGNYSAIEPLLKRSLKIREKALGPEHHHVGQSLNNLSVFYLHIGNYSAAEPLLKRGLKIREKALGSEHPAVATSLISLASLYHDIGNYSAAEPLLKRSLEIQEKALGPEHPAVAISLEHLATLSAAMGNNRQSLELQIRAQTVYEEIIEQVSGFTSSEWTMQYLATTESKMEACLSLVSSRMKDDDSARKAAFGVWLKRKGVLLEAQRRMQHSLLEDGDREAVKVFEELSQSRARIAELSFAGPGKRMLLNYQIELKELNTKKEELEARLSRLSQPYALARKVNKVTVEEVAKTLPQGTVLVDFARINVYNFNAMGNEESWLPAHYLGFVLRPGQGQNVALLDLGPAAPIDQTISQINYAVNELKKAKTKEQAEAAPREINRKLQEISRKLHDQIFAPLEKELGGAQRIFLSPDGALSLLPFEILKDPNGKYLIEKYTFNYLAAGRDLVGFGEKKASTEKPLLIGDPDFDLDRNKKNQVLTRLGMQANTAVAAVRSVEKLSLPFERLEKTGEEVNAISDLIGKSQCEVFLGESALEEVLYSRKAPRILHLATHGFFLTDQGWSAVGDFRGIGGTVSFESMEQPFGRPLGPRANLENPLLRSGIALAGANRAGSSGQGSDGILTADEVLGLRLRGTELVVLSACETGLGEVKTGEGVFGLRRAFTQAGARSMVMSMWSVPDRETQELMVEFYKNILSGKMDRCQALRQAALKMKQKYGDNPYYWGAFVFLGQAD